jgi:hypothetical protein
MNRLLHFQLRLMVVLRCIAVSRYRYIP